MGLIWSVAAVLWGVAEATVFFIVPDVLVTAAVLKFGIRPGLRLAVVAALAASLAGLAMWLWGAHDAASARHVMLWIPTIGPDLLARAHREIGHNWPVHLLAGALTGVPYKLYAVEAGARGINPTLFALASFAARLSRFLVAAGLAALGRQALVKLQWSEWAYALWAAGWITLYAVYLSLRAVA
jgi:hypothetical protein